MRERREDSKSGWLATPSTPAEAELRQALDEAAAREADEVALRRVWARVSEAPSRGPLGHGLPQDGEGRSADYQQQLDELRKRRVRWPWIVAASLAGATATLAFMLIEKRSEFRVERASPVTTKTATDLESNSRTNADPRSM